MKIKDGLTCDTGPHLGPHARRAHSQKRLELTGGPGAMRRMLRCRTRQECCPPSSPRSLNATLQQLRRPLCLVLRQQGQETGCFGRPSTSDLASEDDEPGPLPFASQFWVCPFFPPSRHNESCAWSGRGPCPGNPVKLTSASIASWAPPNKDNPSATTSNRLPSTPGACDKSKSTDHHVGRDPCSALSTDACHSNLHLETSTDQST